MNGTPGAASALSMALLMFVAGIGIPLMATLNARLGQQIGSPVAATAILFAGGMALALIALAFAGRPAAGDFRAVPVGYYLGAFFIVFYILSITWAGPRIGIGNAVFCVLLGQLIAAALIDHFGLWGAMQSALTGRRLLGIVVMAVGVYLARRTQ